MVDLIIVLAIITLCGLCVLGLRSHSVRKFDQKWPPIDDDEFIRRCHSGVDRTVALRVRAIVAEQLGISYDQIYPEQNFVNDLDCC